MERIENVPFACASPPPTLQKPIILSSSLLQDLHDRAKRIGDFVAISQVSYNSFAFE